jgi:hypothetical protein
MLTNTQERTHKLIEAFEPKSAYDVKRLAKAIELFEADLNRATNDSGLYGKVAELFSHDSKSTTVRVQAQNRVDTRIIVDEKRKATEYKTNGGRIGKLYEMSTRARKSTYIVYELDYIAPAGKPRKDGSRKPAEYRRACKVMTVAQFIELVESVKATKVIGHNDSDREIAVQGDSKKLYKALIEGDYNDYIVGFHYISEDFE